MIQILDTNNKIAFFFLRATLFLFICFFGCARSLLWHEGSLVVAHGLGYPAACGVFPDQGSNPSPLHCKADSQPLDHQGSPSKTVLILKDPSLVRETSTRGPSSTDSVAGARPKREQEVMGAQRRALAQPGIQEGLLEEGKPG